MFDLTENPFTVLGITPRATKPEIHDAVEEAMLDADSVETERKLDIARQALIAPNERLRAELGYLLEMRPAEARRALRCASGTDWLEVARATDGVARTNASVQAVVAAHTPASGRQAFEMLFEAWERVNESEISVRVNEVRSVAGVPEADLSDIRQALSELMNYQANRALQHIALTTALPRLLSDFLLTILIPSGKITGRFPAAVLTAYSRQMGGALAGAAEEAIAGLHRYVADPSSRTFDDFERQLKMWDELAQPLQLASQAKGVDDAHSKDLYERIRRCALDLANDEDQHREALKITELSAKIFAELPWASDAIEKDAQDLNEIIANKARDRLLAPLRAAIEVARENLGRTSKHLMTSGFAANCPDPIGAIWRSYVEILDPGLDLEARDFGARMIRGLAISLFNERSDALQAKMLTSQLIADRGWFSADVQKQLVEDENKLVTSIKFQQLEKANKRGDWKLAKEICGELIEMSPSSEIPDLRAVERTLNQKLRSRTIGKVVWGSLAAVILCAIVLDSGGPSNPGPGNDYDSLSDLNDTAEMPADEAFYSAGGPATGEVVDGLEEEVVEEEVAPPVYTYGTLSLPQLRYCLRQGERLDLARNLVSDYTQQTRFNSAISDYNSRCGSFRYNDADMAIAEAELASLRGQLQSEADDIVGPGLPTTTLSDAPPPVNSYGAATTGETHVDEWTSGDMGPNDLNNPYGEFEGE